MVSDPDSIVVQKAWLVVVLVIAILGNWELVKGDNEHAGRKLVVHSNPGTLLTLKTRLANFFFFFAFYISS